MYLGIVYLYAIFRIFLSHKFHILVVIGMIQDEVFLHEFKSLLFLIFMVLTLNLFRYIECFYLLHIFGWSHNPEIPARAKITGFPRATWFSCIAAVRVAVCQSYRLYNNSHVFLYFIGWKNTMFNILHRVTGV